MTASDPDAVPVGSMRKAIARNLMASLQQTAQVTSFFEIDATPLLERRAALNGSGTPVGFDAILVAAVARALREQPLLNGCLVDDRFVPSAAVNVGVAVALDESFGVGGGLVVPVVAGADTKSVAAIAEELADKVRRARERALGPDDMAGGTFTISNLGGLPGAAYWRGATPIISGRQSGILAIGRIREAVVVGPEHRPGVRPVVPLSLTHDHRLIDGAAAGSFVEQLVLALSEPELATRHGAAGP